MLFFSKKGVIFATSKCSGDSSTVVALFLGAILDKITIYIYTHNIFEMKKLFFTLNMTAIFCLGLSAQISGKVFLDLNKSGTQESDEPSMPHVTIKAYKFSAITSVQPLLVQVETDVLGNYSISPGSFPVKLMLEWTAASAILPSGKEILAPTAGNLFGKDDAIIQSVTIVNFPIQLPVGYKVN